MATASGRRPTGWIEDVIREQEARVERLRAAGSVEVVEAERTLEGWRRQLEKELDPERWEAERRRREAALVRGYEDRHRRWLERRRLPVRKAES